MAAFHALAGFNPLCRRIMFWKALKLFGVPISFHSGRLKSGDRAE